MDWNRWKKYICRKNRFNGTNDGIFDRLKNYARVYRDKIIAIEKQCQEKGLSYFDNNPLRYSIEEYLALESHESFVILAIINDKLDRLKLLYSTNLTSKLANKMLEKYVEFYNKKISKTETFSIDKNLKDILLALLLDYRYDLYKEGDFIQFYNEMFTILSKLGMKDVFLALDEEMRPLVISSELRLEEYQQEKGQAKHK